jgi:hypothetical protein
VIGIFSMKKKIVAEELGESQPCYVCLITAKNERVLQIAWWVGGRIKKQS